MLWHFQHCRSSHGHHCCGHTTDCFQLHLEERMAKISPKFSVILLCPSGNPWLGMAAASQGSTAPAPGPGPGPERGSRAASTFCVRAAASSQCLRGAAGECDWVEVCAASLVRQSRSLSSPAALGQIGSRHRSPTVGDGAGTALLHFDPCCLGELLTMLSQPPMMQDLAELVFLGGQGSLKTKA